MWATHLCMLHWRHEKLIYVKFSGKVICLRHMITLAHMYGTQSGDKNTHFLRAHMTIRRWRAWWGIHSEITDSFTV